MEVIESGRIPGDLNKNHQQYSQSLEVKPGNVNLSPGQLSENGKLRIITI